MEKRGRGYVGKSMSVNAKAAYSQNEMPKSKWTKAAILEAIWEDQEELYEKAKDLPAWVLKDMLVRSSWHHTGALYNQTNFYTFNFERLERLTEAEIEEMKASRKKKLEATKEERQAEKEARSIRRSEKEELEYLKSFRHLTSYKSDGGFLKAVKAGRITLEELEAKAIEAATKEYNRLKEIWTNQKYEAGLQELADPNWIKRKAGVR